MSIEWRCIVCRWLYVDPKGMGVHRVPIACPECGGKMRGAPVPTEWDTDED